MDSLQKWLRSTSFSPPTVNQRRQSEGDRDEDPRYGMGRLLADQERGIYAPATSKDVDNFDKLAAFLKLSGLGIGESTLEGIMR
jgi:hypothetical protein